MTYETPDEIRDMDTIAELIRARTDVEDGYLPSGAVVLCLFTSLEGQTLLEYQTVGGMNEYTAEGILRSSLRRFQQEDGWEGADDDLEDV